MNETQFQLSDKVLVLRLTRLGMVPTGLYAAQILTEKGLPLLALEYGYLKEEKEKVEGEIFRLRFACGWAKWFPQKIQLLLIFLNTLLKISSRIFEEGKPRIIIAHGLHEQCMAFLLHLIFDVPYAIHSHEIYEWRNISLVNRLFLLFEEMAMRRATFLIFPEKERANILKKRYGFSCPVYLAFNCPRLRGKPVKADLRKELSLPKKSQLLFYIGGIGPANAIEEGIRAVADHANVYFLMSGWGETAYINSLKALAKKLGMENRFIYLGQVPDKWKYLDNCDASYCIYRPDELRTQHLATASNKLLEAMAAGLPVITTNMPDFKAIVEEYDIGVTAKAITADAISKALKELLTDEVGLKRKSENGIKAHTEIFHYEKQFAPILKAILALFPKRKSSKSQTSRAVAS